MSLATLMLGTAAALLSVTCRASAEGPASTSEGVPPADITGPDGPQLAPPGARYNLSGWALQTCLASPRTVQGAALQTYASSHFYLDSAGAIVFSTPSNSSSVTVHSSHPRTELRETKVPDWRWGDGGVHVLRARCVVDQVPAPKPETIIAQIHGSVDEEIAKVLKLRWSGLGGLNAKGSGRVTAQVKQPVAPYDEIGLDCGTYRLGEPLAYEVAVSGNGTLRVTVNQKVVTYNPPRNLADRFYFKAGNYNQCNAQCDPRGVALVRFFAVNTTHRAA